MPVASMHRTSRPEGLELSSPPLSRSQSVSSDRPGTARLPSLLTPPASTSLNPAYIAASAASQIVTTDHDAQAYGWFTEEGIAPSGETALVSANSLKLVNSFLDQLLFNFLSVARSTSLTVLRPAVYEVLKPTLAKEAIAGADQELGEYLGSGDDEELLGPQEGLEVPGEWDVEVAWKQTRLRCMVYSSLGDVEEEDEDTYLEQEQLNSPDAANGRFPDHPFIISPAVAIFLTSILEFIGEQTLIVAGQAAYQRLRSRRRDSDAARSANDIAERVVVEELDTEKVALNATLGRLWRTWRKRLRSPNPASSRPLSRDSPFRRYYQHSIASSSRRSSFDGVESHTTVPEHSRTISLAEVLEEDVAAFIPLPMTNYDVEEIEVPGLAYLDPALVEQSRAGAANLTGRPRSLILFPWASEPSIAPESAEVKAEAEDTAATPTDTHPGTKSETQPAAEAEGQAVTEADAAGEVAMEEEEEVAGADAETTPETAPDTQTTPTASTPARSRPRARSLPTPPRSLLSSVVDEMAEHSNFVTPMQTPNHKADPMRSTDGQPRSPSDPNGDVPEQVALASDPRQVDGSPRDGKAVPPATSRASKVDQLIDRYQQKAPQPRPTPADVGAEAAGQRQRGTSDAQDAPFYESASENADEEGDDPAAIGVARTSNKSVPAVMYSPPLSVGAERQRSMLMGGSGSDEGPPRPADSSQVAMEPASHRRISSTDSHRSTSRDVSKGVAPTASTASPGPPPLAPLRELMESAVDTSDESSSVTPSQRSATTKPQAGPEAQSATEAAPGSRVSHVRQWSNASRSSERWQAPPVASLSPPTERATVQRVYSPTVMAPREPTTLPRRSESFGKSHQSLYSSGPSTSPVTTKVKILGIRNETEPVTSTARSSEESRSIKSDHRFSAAAVKPGDRGKSFEKLMQSDETMKYTLTPQSMREMDVGHPRSRGWIRSLTWTQTPESPRYGQVATPTADLADFIRNTGPPEAAAPVRTPSQRSKLASNPLNVLRSHSTQSNQTSRLSPSTTNSSMGSSKRLIPVSSPAPSSFQSTVTRFRPGAPIAREARIERSSIRDFADFIRSTGPTEEAKQAAAQPAGASSALGAGPGPKRGVLSKSASTPQALGGTRVDSLEASRAKTRLRARDAAVRQSNNDLIDFIRQGPPSEAHGSNGLTTTAPRAGGVGSALGASRGARMMASSSSLQNGSLNSQAQSLTSSTNSQSALLDKSPQPARKQRRVKDPYAIDMDDEDEDDDLSSTPKPRRDEESLMDFLKSVAPASAPATTSVFHDVAKPSVKAPTSTTSTPRATMGASKSIESSKPLPAHPPEPAGRVGNGVPQLSLGSNSPLFSGSGSGGLGVNASGAKAQTNGQSRPGQVRIPPGAVRSTPRPTPGVAREGRSDIGSSRDLAAFLRSSGPPEPPPPTQPFAPVTVKEEPGGFAKIFRKKKTARVA
ncbi:MAG: hypothetical protein M1838_000947 [Thelocarpon superellum]|nr:MAG: hypothetical protein M1838_000947 [Thelocarpon superellum]